MNIFSFNFNKFEKNDFERLTHVKSIHLKGLELKGEFFFQPMMQPGMPQNMGFTGNFPMQSTGMVSLYWKKEHGSLTKQKTFSGI